jgi:hypothetical protein
LPDLPPATPRGPAINVSNFGGGRCRTCRQQPPGGRPSTSPTPVVAATGPTDSTPQGAHHRRLQLQWWSLPKIPTAPPGGPPSTSPTPVVATVRNPDTTPQGPAVNVFSSGGGRCRACRQHPPGGHRRRFTQLGTCPSIFLATPTRGATAVNITTTSKQLGRKMEARVSVKKFQVLAVPRTREL